MKHLPIYIQNGGIHDVLNVPIGLYQRATLVKLFRRLLKSQATLETMLACEARKEFISVCSGLLEILTTDFRLRTNRQKIHDCMSAHEENLKSENNFDIYQFAIATGLVTACFLLAAALPESIFY